MASSCNSTLPETLSFFIYFIYVELVLLGVAAAVLGILRPRRSAAGIGDIPPEVHQEVFLYLEPTEVFLLQAVSRRFRNTIHLSPRLRQYLHVQGQTYLRVSRNSPARISPLFRTFNPFAQRIFGNSIGLWHLVDNNDTFPRPGPMTRPLTNHFHTVLLQGQRAQLSSRLLSGSGANSRWRPEQLRYLELPQPFTALTHPNGTWKHTFLTQPPVGIVVVHDPITYEDYPMSSMWIKFDRCCHCTKNCRLKLCRSTSLDVCTAAPRFRHQDDNRGHHERYLVGFKLGDLVGENVDNTVIKRVRGLGGNFIFPRGASCLTMLNLYPHANDPSRAMIPYPWRQQSRTLPLSPLARQVFNAEEEHETGEEEH